MLGKRAGERDCRDHQHHNRSQTDEQFGTHNTSIVLIVFR
jgi:hypothetical protein